MFATWSLSAMLDKSEDIDNFWNKLLLVGVLVALDS